MNYDHFLAYSFDISELHGVFNSPDELLPVSNVMNLFLYFWTRNVTQTSLPQKLIRYNTHNLTMLLICPQCLQTPNSVLFDFLLGFHVLPQAANLLITLLIVSETIEEFLKVLVVVKDEGEDGLDIVLGDIFGLIVTTFSQLVSILLSVLVLRYYNLFFQFKLNFRFFFCELHHLVTDLLGSIFEELVLLLLQTSINEKIWW